MSEYNLDRVNSHLSGKNNHLKPTRWGEGKVHVQEGESQVSHNSKTQGINKHFSPKDGSTRTTHNVCKAPGKYVVSAGLLSM